MHGVRESLLQAQAASVGLPLFSVPLPQPCSNAIYEQRMGQALKKIRLQGISGIAFGDLFLEEVRAYRERQLAASGFRSFFPLWGLDTPELAWEMIGQGLRAILTCVDPRFCPKEMVGRDFNAQFLEDLSAEVDPCGENGEFHTFAYGGPCFSRPIFLERGRIVERDGFVFHDLLPGPEVGGAPIKGVEVKDS